MHPLSQQAAGIVDLVTYKLDLDLLVHVHLFGLDEAAHQDVVLLDAHEIRALHPGNAQLFEVVPEPSRLLLEGEVFDLLRREIVNVGLYEFDGGLLPLELRVAIVNGFLSGTDVTLT